MFSELLTFEKPDPKRNMRHALREQHEFNRVWKREKVGGGLVALNHLRKIKRKKVKKTDSF